MKYLLKYIVFVLCLFNGLCHASETVTLPDDFTGQITRHRMQTTVDGENYIPSIGEYAYIGYEIGKYFYEKYPNIQSEDEDLLMEELSKFFPDDSTDELFSKLKVLRRSIALYAGGLNLYNKYVQSKIIPETIKTVHSSEDFDHPDEVSYMEARPKHFYKVYNFKKFLTYSSNQDEIEAITKYQRQNADELSFIDKIDDIMQKVNWKKVWFYGDIYKNPLLSELGTMPFVNDKEIKIRVISPNTYINNQKTLYLGVQIITDPQHFVLANSINILLHKPLIQLKDSDNIQDYEVLYPAPFNSQTLQSVYKYFGNFLLPIRIDVTDPKKALIAEVSAELVVCNGRMKCHPKKFNMNLKLDPKGPDYLPNGYSNFFTQTLLTIPTDKTDKIHLEKFVVDTNEGGDSLRAEFKTNEKIRSFHAYIEENSGYSVFDAPLISVQDNRIYVRFMQHTQNNSVKDLENLEFTLTAVLNNKIYFRKQLIASKASPFDINGMKFSISLLFLAFLGGFLLNFMPCVFPVLSFKISALTKISSMHTSKVKQDLFLTICGTFFGFTILISLLLITKYLDYSLGWGMQFQNIEFIVIMCFVLILLIRFSQNSYVMPNAVAQMTGSKKWYGFYLGTLLVLLSTPCTGPYLATAVGFALSGTYTDIILILYAVALGLTLPYILLLTIKNPKELFPKPGPWMNKLNHFSRILLFITILWLLLLILEQTDWICLTKIIFLLCLFCIALFIYHNLTQFFTTTIFYENELKRISKIKTGLKIFICTAFLLCCSLSAYIARSSYQLNYLKHMESRQTLIDQNLIQSYLSQGKPVLVEIRADWCLTCHFNSFAVLSERKINSWKEKFKLEFITVDWTNYNQQILEFMEKYGRKGLPFYILYTPFMREGLVLPEILEPKDIESFLYANR